MPQRPGRPFRNLSSRAALNPGPAGVVIAEQHAPVTNARLSFSPGKRVKYFGRELPPKCALRDCWLSDDGEHYYCTDFTCNRHKYRRTKHDRYSRYQHRDPAMRAQPVPVRGPLVYFKCPKCASADIQMRLLQNRYECSGCQFVWR